MSEIDEMIINVLKHEGGYVNDPADKGGATNLGVTQATLSAYLGRKASIQEVKDLTRDVVAKIYKQNYYLKPKIDQLPELIQPIVFDIGVNSGPKKGIRMLQEVLNANGFQTGAPDGAIGPNTIKQATAAVEKLGNNLVNLMVDRRKAFYQAIIDKNPSQARFRKGWMARAESFRVDDTGFA